MMDIQNYNPIQSSQSNIRLKLKIRLWAVINNTLFRYSPFFCRSFRRLLVVAFGGKVHSTASLNRKAIIDCPWNFTIGPKSSIGADSWIYALDEIIIGEKTCIGNEVKLITGSHRIEQSDFKLVTRPIKIGSCCWIATSATLLPGIIVGDGAVIGTCSVVTKDVEPWTVAAGNPAKFIKNRDIQVYE